MEELYSITFQHIYREVNDWADKLSKLALALPPGLMEVTHFVNNQEVNKYVSLQRKQVEQEDPTKDKRSPQNVVIKCGAFFMHFMYAPRGQPMFIQCE